MKNTSPAKAILLMLALAYAGSLSAQNLQTTDVPRIVSYQGHITNADGAVTGVHPITVRLYSDPNGKHKLWEDTYTTDVKDGIFSVVLGTRNPLPPTHRLDRPIWLGVSIEGTAELRPLTQFTAAPYALSVPDKSITKEKLSEDLQTLITKPIGGQEKQTVPNWTSAGDPYGCSGEVLGTNTAGCDLVLVTYGSQVMRYKYSATSNNILGGYSGNTLGSGAGNIIAGGGESGQINAIGANAATDYGVISGGWGNDLDGGGSFIGAGEDNSLIAEWAFIGGGYSNDISGGTNGSNYSAILGGYNNDLTGQYSAIVAGKSLTITGDNVLGFNGGASASFTGDKAFYLNDVDQHLDNADNTARKLMFYEPSGTGNNVTTFKAQGQSADINYLLPSTLGTQDQVLSLTSVSGTTGTLGWADGGGAINWKLAGNAGLTDGTNNFLGTTSSIPIRIITNNTERARVLSTGEVGIGTSTPGTLVHALLTNSTTGGLDNLLTLAHNSSGTAATGFGTGVIFKLESSTTNDKDAAQMKVLWKDANNSQLEAAYELHLAGKWNEVSSTPMHRVWRAEHNGENPNIIGGDENNAVNTGVGGATISGGGTTSSINRVSDFFGTVGGGRGNLAGDNDATLNDAEFATVAGGLLNAASGEESFVGGGSTNSATKLRATIAGGINNNATDEQTFIGGGSGNTASAKNNVVAGGLDNIASGLCASIGGGGHHVASGEVSTIPGGDGLSAIGFGQTVTGIFNTNPNTGTFPASSRDNFRGQKSAESILTRINHTKDRLFVIGNGYIHNGGSTETNENAAEVTNKGTLIVYGNLSKRGPDAPTLTDASNPSINTNEAPPNNFAEKAVYGEVTQDNTLIAWGDVQAAPQFGGNTNINSSFGVDNVTWDNFNNHYVVTLSNTSSSTDPNQNTGITQASITATVSTDAEAISAGCFSIVVSRINNNVFKVFIYNITSGCLYSKQPFMFKVVGRR